MHVLAAMYVLCTKPVHELKDKAQGCKAGP